MILNFFLLTGNHSNSYYKTLQARNLNTISLTNSDVYRFTIDFLLSLFSSLSHLGFKVICNQRQCLSYLFLLVGGSITCLQWVAYKLILVLMSNYNHPYSDYLNHILNRSPSKKTYSFGKSERFGQIREEMQITE